MTVVTLRAFGCVALRLGGRRLVTRHSPFRNSLLVIFFCWSMPQVHFKSGPAFIKRNGVSEEPDVVVRCGKREATSRQDTHRAHSVPKIKCIEDVRKLRGQREIYSPNADKFDVDVNGELFFEFVALIPARVVVARVHFVGEWDLLAMAWRKEPNLYIIG